MGRIGRCVGGREKMAGSAMNEIGNEAGRVADLIVLSCVT